MIAVSDAWKSVHERFILPESFLEIECAVTEEGVQESASAAGTNEEVFSQVENILGLEDNVKNQRYATLEHNLWALDGSRSILSDSAPYENVGYVSSIDQSGSVTVTVPTVHTTALPGVTIIWSNEFGEYPPVFTVTAYNDSTVVAETTVTNNTEQRCLVDLEIKKYNRVTVTVHNWSLPYRRARIELVYLGHLLLMDKNDIISYTHTQSGDLLTGELPKYSIEFSLDNTDGRWNPSNPVGMAKYLLERQKLTVRYGLDVNGYTEWIKAGTFYLSEWSAPSNGLEAHFVARDILEFLLTADNTAAYYADLASLVEYAVYDLLPEGASIEIDNALTNYYAEYNGDGTSGEMIQKAANGACCILRYDRDGMLHVEPINVNHTNFTVPLALAFSHPEIALSKPLKSVSVDYGSDQPYVLEVSSSGETQTVDNSFITTEEQATEVAAWVSSVLKSRKTVSGEFRADPRLDLYDVITVESKFGTLSPVILTEIRYTFSGFFKASYTGRIVGEGA